MAESASRVRVQCPNVDAKERPGAADGPLATDPTFLFNRELSWLDFNERVLLQATNNDHPLLERVKFLAIVSSNLDEFFMIRVASLLRKMRAGLDDTSPDGLTTSAVLKTIRRRAADMIRRQRTCWSDILRPLLREHGIAIVDLADYTPAIAEFLQTHFAREVAPALTPLAFDPGHPFPFISNQSLNLAVVVKHGGKSRFARVKVPDVLPRFIPLPPALSAKGVRSFVLLEDVMRSNLAALFPGTEVKGAHLFHIVRDADLVIQEDEADDLLESVDEGLKQSRRGALSMLMVEATTPRRVVETLVENFEIEDENVYRVRDRMRFSDWMALAQVGPSDLKYPPFVPAERWTRESPEEIFGQIRARDRIVHHPFQSFGDVQAFVAAAVEDPAVVAIKMTLYRIGADSPLVDLLVEAAEAGKQVAVLVELKARFDERNNIKWATRLEAAGVHVTYGLVNLKTHAKICLVVRKEYDGIRRYVHFGTGNYNPGTARAYTDLGYFTVRQAIVEDASDVFNYLTGYSDRREYQELVVAPTALRHTLVSIIDRERLEAEAGRPAALIFKVNALTDVDIIRRLYAASQAGASIDLIVRGICCLRPGMPGVSEHIRVRSVVGRFLEHSRILWCLNAGTPRVWIGSADVMERNLDRRVETFCPVLDPEWAEHLRDVVLALLLKDNVRAYLLQPDGKYRQAEPVDGEPAVDSQQELLNWYLTQPRDDR
jgi:polyphosphate kinase